MATIYGVSRNNYVEKEDVISMKSDIIMQTHIIEMETKLSENNRDIE